MSADCRPRGTATPGRVRSADTARGGRATSQQLEMTLGRRCGPPCRSAIGLVLLWSLILALGFANLQAVEAHVPGDRGELMLDLERALRPALGGGIEAGLDRLVESFRDLGVDLDRGREQQPLLRRLIARVGHL